MTDPKFLKKLQLAIQKNTGCKSKHVETESLVEKKKGAVLWEADVEVFSVIDHDKAKLCYAWTYDQGDAVDYVTVLKLPPVTSAKKAVQLWIEELKK